MGKEPKLSDDIYEEIRKCEKYALLNLISYEAAIRNTRVREILGKLDSDGESGYMGDFTNEIFLKVQELKNEYFFDYYAHRKYHGRVLNKEHIENMSHKFHTSNDKGSHIHYNILPFPRPKMFIPQGENIVSIEIPMNHIHPKDIRDYYLKLAEKHLIIAKETKNYHDTLNLDFKEDNERKSKADTYAEMFFVWDYVNWSKKQQKIITSASMFYYDISTMLETEVNEQTGRSSKVTKYLEVMNKLINKCGYRWYYTDEK